jgi:hypothetical protein
VNGVEGGGTGCVPLDEPWIATTRAEDGTATANRAGWAQLGVLPGRESTIRIRLAPGSRADEVGVALYERSGPRITSDGVVLRERMNVGGTVYRLEDYETRPWARDAASLELAVAPGADGPGVIVAGFLTGIDDDASRTLAVDGEVVSTGGASGLGTMEVNTRPSTVRMSAGGGTAGTLVVAHYVAEFS